MRDNSRIELWGFNKIDRYVRTEWSRTINHKLIHIRIEKITDTNSLMKAVIVYVGKRFALKFVEVKIKTKRNPGGKDRLKNDKWSLETHKHLGMSPQRKDKEERKIWGTLKEVK